MSTRTDRVKQIVLWRIYSSISRVIIAPLVAAALYGGYALLPDIALALALGPFAAPLSYGDAIQVDVWVWYIVVLSWAADMCYFLYFVDGWRVGASEEAANISNSQT